MFVAQVPTVGAIALLAVMVVVVVILMAPFVYLLRLWVQAMAGGVCIPLVHLVGMKLRRVPPGLIVAAAVKLHAAGHDVPVHRLETVYLADPRRIRFPEELVHAVHDLDGKATF